MAPSAHQRISDSEDTGPLLSPSSHPEPAVGNPDTPATASQHRQLRTALRGSERERTVLESSKESPPQEQQEQSSLASSSAPIAPGAPTVAQQPPAAELAPPMPAGASSFAPGMPWPHPHPAGGYQVSGVPAMGLPGAPGVLGFFGGPFGQFPGPTFGFPLGTPQMPGASMLQGGGVPPHMMGGIGGLPFSGMPMGAPQMWPGVVGKPAGTRVRIVLGEDAMEVTIPPASCFSGGPSASAATLVGFSVVWLTFVSFWAISAASAGAPFPFVAFSLIFFAVGLAMLFQGIQGLTLQERISFFRQQQHFVAQRDLLGWISSTGGLIRDISLVDLRVTSYTNGRPNTTCIIVEGVREHSFGAFLTFTEQHWILSELSRNLQVPIGPGLSNFSAGGYGFGQTVV